MILVILLKLVYIYLAEAASLPPIFLLPNYPIGNNKLILFDPTKSYAIPIIV